MTMVTMVTMNPATFLLTTLGESPMNTSTHEESSPNWFGWLWTGDSWERVCSAPTLPECSRRLGAECRRRGVQEKYSCLTAGGAPRFVPFDQKARLAAHGRK